MCEASVFDASAEEYGLSGSHGGALTRRGVVVADEVERSVDDVAEQFVFRA